MEIEVKKKYFERALEKVHTVPVVATAEGYMKSFLLEAMHSTEGDQLKIVRMNETQVAVSWTDIVKVIDDAPPTKLLINAEKLLSLVKNVTEDALIIKANDEFTFRISAGNFWGDWTLFDVGRYPEIPEFEDVTGINEIEVDAETFVKSIERVKYAIEGEVLQSSSKQIIFEGKDCWVASADQYQRVATGFPYSSEQFFLTLPLRALDIVQFIQLSGADKIRYAKGENYDCFFIKSDMYLCKTPNVTPRKASELLATLDEAKQGKFLVDVKELTEVIRRIGITSEEQYNRILFTAKDSGFLLSSADEYGNKSFEMFVTDYTGSSKAPKEFKVNWHRLEEALRAVKDDMVMIRVDKKYLVLEGDDSLGLVPMGN